jgi:hypothetical protein
MRLFKMLGLGYVLCRMSKPKADALAVPTRREAPAFDHGHLMNDVGATRCYSSSIGRRLPLSAWKPAWDRNGSAAACIVTLNQP